MKYAFRCRTCRHLVDAGAAGERTVPAACPACGAGVSFDPSSGVKQYDEDNWIILADLPAEELDEVLAFHAIEKRDVERHAPLDPTAARAPQEIERTAEETITTEDRAG